MRHKCCVTKDFSKSIGSFERAQWKGVDDNDNVLVVVMTTMATQKGKPEMREKMSNWNLEASQWGRERETYQV